jgi:predicted TPR repeat methyltransferase
MNEPEDEAPPPGEPGTPGEQEEPAAPEERPPAAAMPAGPVLDFYLFEKAKALQKSGSLAQAEECYRQLLERDPRSLKALNNLGVLLEAQKRTAEAERVYRRALQIHPNSADVLYNLGHALQADGRLHDAEQCYRRAISLDAMSFPAYYNLGRLLQHQERLEEAEACYRRASEIVPESAPTHGCLGETLYQLGRFEEALAAFELGVACDPEAGVGYFNVGKALDALGRLDEAVGGYARAVERDPDSAVARENLVRGLERLGRRDDAVHALAEWLFHAPGHAIATHLLAAISGLEVPARASDAYVRETFDPFAADYDSTLERLSYRGPVLIAMALAQGCGEPHAALDVLDAGCGTGLCGAALRPYARRLSGLDLSSGMLARAEHRGIYDELIRAEIVAGLGERPGAFDLIVSADTLSYFGPLERVFAAAALALRPHGHLIFTVEHLAGGDDANHRLEPTGRYSHTEPYVRRALDTVGLAPRVVLRGALRHEGGQPVAGLVVVAERPPRAPLA